MKVFLQNHKKFEKYFKLKFDAPDAKVHKNEFISVAIDWHPKKSCIDSYRFKYPDLVHTMYGGDIVEKRKRYFNVRTASFKFPDLKDEDFADKQMCSWFDVCLVVDTEEEVDQNEFDYLTFNQTKYGVIVWFAPRGWEDWKNTKPLE